MRIRKIICLLPCALFGLMPLLSGRYYALPFLGLVFYCLYFGKTKYFRLDKLLKILPLLLLYVLFCFTLLYTPDKELAAKKIFETRLGLVLIPLGTLFIQPISKKQSLVFVQTFGISTILFAAYYAYSLIVFPDPINPSFAFPSSFYFKTVLSGMPYLGKETFEASLIIGLNLIIQFFSLRFYSFRGKLLGILSAFSSVFILLCAASKAVLIFLVILLFFYIIKQKVSAKQGFSLLVICLLGFFLAIQVPSIKWELKEIRAALEGNKIARNDSFVMRKNIVLSGLQLAKNTNPLLGNGVGAVQPKLDKIYEENNFSNLLERKYDSHNQYLGIYLETGVLGLFLLVLQLFSSIRSTIPHNQGIFTILLLYLAFLFLVENIIFRQLGVLLTATIISIANLKSK